MTQGQHDELTIECLVSQGSTFSIYKARRGSKYVILKTVTHPDSMTLALLRREYELGATLSHPSLVNTIGYEYDTPVGAAIVLEYVNGTPLGKFISSSPSASQRRSVLRDILSGTEYLHRRGILHNDLKPDNIMVNGNRSARIIDFGLSESEDNIYPGAIGGSAGYSAPEILAGKGSAGAASDIYSIGKLTAFIFGCRRYRSLVRRCLADSPLKRPGSIQAFRKQMLLSDIRPFLVAIILVIAAAGITLATKTVTSMSDRNHISNEMALPLDKAIRNISREHYRETALIYYNLYIKDIAVYIDSIQRLYPIRPDGTIPPQLAEACAISGRQQARLDSIIALLPSIGSLPPAAADSAYARFNERFRPEEYSLR